LARRACAPCESQTSHVAPASAIEAIRNRANENHARWRQQRPSADDLHYADLDRTALLFEIDRLRDERDRLASDKKSRRHEHEERTWPGHDSRHQHRRELLAEVDRLTLQIVQERSNFVDKVDRLIEEVRRLRAALASALVGLEKGQQIAADYTCDCEQCGLGKHIAHAREALGR